MKNIITITGDLGAGKSTVAKKICEITGMDYFSTGTIQRKIAEQRGIDTLQLNKDCRNDKSVDELIDCRLKEMNVDDTDNIILDSRLGWFFVSSSFKVYLSAIPQIAASRVFNDDKRSGEPIGSQQTVLNNLLERQKEENERFFGLYGIDCSNREKFDMVVDTSFSSVEEISKLIISAFEDYKKGKKPFHDWISPKALVPCCDINSSIDCNLVSAINYKNLFFIHKGAHRVGDALRNKLSLIPFSKSSGIDMIPQIDVNRIHDWEKDYGFKFNEDYLKIIYEKI